MSPDQTALPPLLAYAFSLNPSPLQVSTDTATTGQIIVTVGGSPTVLCQTITISVPIGIEADDVYSVSPTPKIISSSANWAPSSAFKKSEATGSDIPTNFQTFTLNNSAKGYAVTDSFTLTINGVVNTAQGTATLLLNEYSAPNATSVYSTKSTSYDMLKAAAPAFYVNNFISSLPGTPTVPATDFANAAAFLLSWESNGTYFELFCQGQTAPLYSGTSTSFSVTGGLATTATFVLRATLDGATLYDTLTVTVSNPSLTPQTVAFGANSTATYQLNNTSDNPVDSQGNGGDPGSLCWEANQAGYVGQFFNASQARYANGLLVKVASTTASAFEVSQGTTAQPAGTALLHVNASGQVGIGTNAPFSQLANTSDNILDSQGYGGNPGSLTWEANQDGYVGQFFNAGTGPIANGVLIKVASTDACAFEVSQGVNVGQVGSPLLHINGNGNVGIGTSTPGLPLDVQAATNLNVNNYGYLNATDPTGKYSSGNSPGVPVSIRAAGRIICPEFDALSDARLKTVLGLSDSAADLARLAQLRVTDYQMRDQMVFGERRYKKVLAQELEQVFPQAVSYHLDFVPDLYVPASQVQRQDDTLALTLPVGLPQAAAAGQRVKLVGPAGVVLATLARTVPAGSHHLFVYGADSLAECPQQVFVFGLEHPDVRAVDYDALTMLNVSATQALLSQVNELRQQNALLREQSKLQQAQLQQQQQQLQALEAKMTSLLSETVFN